MNTTTFKVQTAGRVNLIGEHTDHQLGLVLPVSINAKITIYGVKREDDQVLVYSDNYKENYSLTLSELTDYIPEKGVWFNFIVGILKSFSHLYSVTQGCNIIITSDLPQGVGLSSSAALEIALMTLFEQIYNHTIDPLTVVKMCWEVENNFIGVKCGIMDQFIVRFGQENKVLKINCHNLSFETAILPRDLKIIILDTNIEHKLIDSPYNTRIQECSKALLSVKELGFPVSYLSELSVEDLKKIESDLSDIYYRRIKHVVTENQRVIDFFNILHDEKEKKRPERLGTLLYQSQESLQNDFEASWDRADEIVSYCKKLTHQVYGARMLGGGWGGSVLLLVNNMEKDDIIGSLKNWFFATYDENTTIFEFSTTVGTTTENIAENAIPPAFKHILKQS